MKKERYKNGQQHMNAQYHCSSDKNKLKLQINTTHTHTHKHTHTRMSKIKKA